MGIAEHWSVQQLRDKQDEMAYERSLIAAKPDDEIVRTLENITPQNTDPDVVLKSSYILDFLGLDGYYTEKELFIITLILLIITTMLYIMITFLSIRKVLNLRNTRTKTVIVTM